MFRYNSGGRPFERVTRLKNRLLFLIPPYVSVYRENVFTVCVYNHHRSLLVTTICIKFNPTLLLSVVCVCVCWGCLVVGRLRGEIPLIFVVSLVDTHTRAPQVNAATSYTLHACCGRKLGAHTTYRYHGRRLFPNYNTRARSEFVKLS